MNQVRKVVNTMDYEMYQHCFYDENDTEFAPASLPNEDMWKKFELNLLPTPPHSPRRDDHCNATLDLEDLHFPIDEEEFFGKNSDSVAHKTNFPESPPSNLYSQLIQDCMWSGDSGRYKKPGDKASSCLEVKSTDCVDPAAVFPYPIAPQHNITGCYSETKLHNLGTETPSDSEEEIDVVTVEKQMQSTPVTTKKKAPTFTIQSVKIEKEEICENDKLTTGKTTVTVKAKVDCPTDMHNYSLTSSSLKRVRSLPHSPSDSPRPTKKLKRELSVPELKRVCQKLKSSSSGGSSSNASSRNSSDSEDCPEGKRTQHNVLERKRRNDLKYSFFTLRDSVPDLVKQERAPKVLILKKAVEYIHRLTSEEHRLVAEKDHMKQKHEQLRRTLERLNARDF